MSTVDKILESIGLTTDKLNLLDQTDSLIICRVFEALQQYAMYHNKNPRLERKCEDIQKEIRKRFKVIK